MCRGISKGTSAPRSPVSGGIASRNWALDYYLKADSTLLVIEAKDENLQRRFNQLAVELIALGEWADWSSDSGPEYIYGAVSIGNIWQFSRCDRPNKVITRLRGRGRRDWRESNPRPAA